MTLHRIPTAAPAAATYDLTARLGKPAVLERMFWQAPWRCAMELVANHLRNCRTMTPTAAAMNAGNLVPYLDEILGQHPTAMPDPHNYAWRTICACWVDWHAMKEHQHAAQRF